MNDEGIETVESRIHTIPMSLDEDEIMVHNDKTPTTLWCYPHPPAHILAYILAILTIIFSFRKLHLEPPDKKREDCIEEK